MSLLYRLARNVGGVLKSRGAASPVDTGAVETLLERAAEADGRGEHHDAERLCRDALALAPQSVEGWIGLGLALQLQGRPDEALAALQRAEEIDPRSPVAHYNIGRVHHGARRYAEAAAALTRAAELAPAFVDARILLADAQAESGDRESALEALRAALDVDPAHAGALRSRGRLLYAKGDVDAVLRMYRDALSACPDSADAAIGVALALTEIGRVDESIDIAKGALAAHPAAERARIAYLFNLLLTDTVGADHVAAEHRRIGALYEIAVPQRKRAQPRGPGKRLRVGYLSGDFCAHSSSLFLEHVLELHDRRSFAPIAYSCSNLVDAYTERMRPRFELWRDVLTASDEELARVIEADGVDVLVDLSGYTSASRMGVFAHRPAPVQVTWFAYVSTTGLPAMTHRLTDAVLDPTGSERHSTETLQRLPRSLWCYRPPREALIETGGEMRAEGAVRFGAFNRYAKVSGSAMRLWCAILHALPEATLTMLTVPAGTAQQALIARFEAAGIDRARIRLAPRLSQAQYYAAYRDVDVCLDTTPYSGATTTCDALWMGVPLVTLRGETSVSRSAASILTHAGCGRWIAEDADDYVRIALDVASEGRADAHRRRKLRERFRASAVMDEAGYTRDLEHAFREMRTQACRA